MSRRLSLYALQSTLWVLQFYYTCGCILSSSTVWPIAVTLSLSGLLHVQSMLY